MAKLRKYICTYVCLHLDSRSHRTANKLDFKLKISVTDSKSSQPDAHFYNYSNDMYCMNVNTQNNQFLSYQNYQHEQLMHHQYFEENPHVQNYNFAPYSETFVPPAVVSNIGEQVQDQFPSIQSSELYEFLPEEIFQLDQPILKNESHPFPIVSGTSMESLQMPFPTPTTEVSSTGHSFLDLSSGQIQTNNIKYPLVVEGFSSEINNNSSYQSNVGLENLHIHSKLAEANTYNYQDGIPRLNCAVENEKLLKRKHTVIDSVVKQNIQSYHSNQTLFPKRENSCLLQQSYFPPDYYPTKPNDVYRTMEKFNYITNN